MVVCLNYKDTGFLNRMEPELDFNGFLTTVRDAASPLKSKQGELQWIQLTHI